MREQGVDGREFVAQLLPAREQLVENGGIGLRGAVQQHDRTVVDTRDELGKRLLRGWLVVIEPIDLGEAPKDRMIAHLLRHLQIFLRINPLRRSVELLHRLPRRLREKRLKLRQLLFEGRPIADF